MVHHRISERAQGCAVLGANELQRHGWQLVGSAEAMVKMQIEDLLQGKSISVVLDEQIVFSRLCDKKDAIWSFLMATGYVK